MVVSAFCVVSSGVTSSVPFPTMSWTTLSSAAAICVLSAETSSLAHADPILTNSKIVIAINKM